MYKVANASEYLVITGFGIKDVKVAKKAWILPGQSCRVFDLSPVNYTFEVQAMSADKLPFVLPVVFTIGPNVDDKDSLHKYAKLITKHRRLSHHMKEQMQGIIAGETRVLLASMTMEELFRGTKEFKQEVFKKVQQKLNQFGLWIYNANMRLLVDLLVVIGHEYFAYLRREAHKQASVDMVELVGGKLREWKTLPGAAMIDAKERLIGIATHRAGEGQTLQDAARIDAKKRLVATQRAGEGQKEDIKVSAEVKVFGRNMTEAKGGQKVFGNFALNVEPLQQV